MVAWNRLAVVLGAVMVFVGAPVSATSGEDGDHCDDVTMESVLVEGHHVRSGVNVGEGSLGTQEGPQGVWEESNAMEGLQVEDCYVWEDQDEKEKKVPFAGDVRIAGSQDANEGWDGVQEMVNDTWEDAESTVNETYEDAWQEASEAYEEVGDEAGDAYEDAWQEASEAYEDAAEEAEETYESAWEEAARLADKVVGIINDIW